jgi:hypothetical protein
MSLYDTQTYTGKFIDAFNEEISLDQICIEDIAHSLANTCRFNGHCKQFYSVAEHCVHCCEAIHPTGDFKEDSTLRFWLLLHDSAEVFLSDIPRPIKKTLGKVYKDAETKVLDAIARKFGLPTLDVSDGQKFPYKDAHLIKIIDSRMLATERRDLMSHPEIQWEGLKCIEPYEDLDLKSPWTPEKAEREFLVKFYTLQRHQKIANMSERELKEWVAGLNGLDLEMQF